MWAVVDGSARVVVITVNGFVLSDIDCVLGKTRVW